MTLKLLIALYVIYPFLYFILYRLDSNFAVDTEDFFFCWLVAPLMDIIMFLGLVIYGGFLFLCGLESVGLCLRKVFTLLNKTFTQKG